LVLSDMVKFAKYSATASEAHESLDLARRFVNDTKVEENLTPNAELRTQNAER